MDLGTVAVDVGLIVVTAFLTGVLTLLGFLGRRALASLDEKLDQLDEKLDQLGTRVRDVELAQAQETGRRSVTDIRRERQARP